MVERRKEINSGLINDDISGRELAKAIEQIDTRLSAEPVGVALAVTGIIFENPKLGERALFYIDDFMYTNKEETVFFVKPRTLQILNALGISYQSVDLKAGQPTTQSRNLNWPEDW